MVGSVGQAASTQFQSFFKEEFSEVNDDDEVTLNISQSSIFVQSVNPTRSIDIDFFGEEDTTDTITITFQGPNIQPVNNELIQGYDLPKVIDAYGVPDQILVNPENNPPPGEFIVLIYDNPPLVIDYGYRPPEEKFHDTVNDLYVSCFQMQYLWLFHLVAKNTSLAETVQRYEDDETWTSIKAISGFTVESFSEAILEDEQPCIALPAPPPVVP